LSLQGEVARAIAGQISVKLSPQEETRLSGQRKVNPNAYEAFLKGNFYVYKLSRDGFDNALRYYQLALELDPEYAPAYAGIAFVWGGRAQMGFIPYNSFREHARPAAARALELDSTLAEVHYMKAVIYAWGEWNWDLAKKEFDKVIALNPGMAEARGYYSHLLFTINQPEEAMKQIDHALRLDPFNPLIKAIYAMDLMYARRYDEVIELMENVLKTSPEEYIALSTLRSAYHQKHMYEDAIRIWQLSFKLRKDTVALQTLNKGYAEGGYSLALQRVAEKMIERSESGTFVTPWQIATLYTRAGMPDEAMDWFDKALEAHDSNMPYLTVDPIFDDLRDNPRFVQLLKKIGFQNHLNILN
jgi:adenylate cyclase